MDYDMLYLYISVVSLAFNLYTNKNIQKKLFKEEKRKLKYKILSKQSKDVFKDIRRSDRFDNSKTCIKSFIPFYNVFYTIKHLSTDNDVYLSSRRLFYDYIIKETNDTEEMNREIFLQSLKEIKNDLEVLDDEMKEKINNDELAITEKEFKKVLKMNNISLVEEEVEDISSDERR